MWLVRSPYNILAFNTVKCLVIDFYHKGRLRPRATGKDSDTIVTGRQEGTTHAKSLF